MSINRYGFTATNSGLTIDKDPAARLTYTLDWSEWLEGGDTIAAVEWTAAARRNDPAPIIIETSGISENTQTYIELSGGQENKTYVITAEITTEDGLIDRRNFRINCVARSA
jgi:hypothetical protein